MRTFGWTPQHEFRETIRRMLAWYDEHGVTAIYSHLHSRVREEFRSGRSRNERFSGCNILIVGGAGFVGSNLTKYILAQEPRRLTIVDNLLSADRVNVPTTRPFGSLPARLPTMRSWRIGRRSRLRIPPRLLSRQSIVDSRSVRRSRQQHADLVKAFRAAEGCRNPCARSCMRLRVVQLPKRLTASAADQRGRAGLAVPR